MTSGRRSKAIRRAAPITVEEPRKSNVDALLAIHRDLRRPRNY